MRTHRVLSTIVAASALTGAAAALSMPSATAAPRPVAATSQTGPPLRTAALIDGPLIDGPLIDLSNLNTLLQIGQFQ